MTFETVQSEIRSVLDRIEFGAASGRFDPQDKTVQALASTFPALRLLFGDLAFGWLVRRLARRAQPVRHSRHDVGAGLARLMRAEPALRQLPHAADLAALEWDLHVAKTAPPSPRHGTAWLAADATTPLPALRLRRHSGWRLLISPYPVLDIWLACQPDGGRHVTVVFGEEPTRLLIGRTAGKVTWLELSRRQLMLLRRLEFGRTLSDAAGPLTLDERSAVLAFVHGLFRRGVLAPVEVAAAAPRSQQPDSVMRRPTAVYAAASDLAMLPEPVWNREG